MASQKQFEFCHRALEEVMWGRPASQEELDAWESLTRKKGRKGKKKWKVFGGKEKTKNSKVRHFADLAGLDSAVKPPIKGPFEEGQPPNKRHP